MFTKPLPELRPYLERLLDDALAQSDMTIAQQATREHMLCLLQEELVRFIFVQLMAALPGDARCQFASLLEQEASLETLQAFTMRKIPNIPAFVVQVFQEFRARFIPSERKAACQDGLVSCRDQEVPAPLPPCTRVLDQAHQA